MVSKETIDKFKKLYQDKFNVTVSDEEATQMATDLVNLMRVLLKPDPIQNNHKVIKDERSPDETIGAQ